MLTLNGVQRVFYAFPDGLQGIGLLILRIALSTGLLAEAVPRLHEPDLSAISLALGEIFTGALLLVGLWTSIVAMLASVLQLASLLATHGAIELHLLRSAVGLCLAFVGPCAWSVDARVFGRRRVEIKNLRDN